MPTPSEIQTCINNLTTSSEPINFTLLAAETSAANTGISFSVATVEDLPDLSLVDIGRGQIVFVESIGVPVVNTQNEWRGLDGRVLRRDFFLRSLWTWGRNFCGNLGDGTPSNSRAFPGREFCSATDWCHVSAGANMVNAVKTSGQLWAWGQGACGVLGDGTTVNKCSPVREFCSATDWCQSSAGTNHAAAIKTSGQLWSWGFNFCGLLGDGTLLQRNSPIREICSATDWCHVSLSGTQTLAMKTSGQIWMWGQNSDGTLGNGTTVSSCSPVREFCSATDWCRASVGCQNASAVKTSGEIWSWGRNIYGSIGDGTTVNKCSPIREICSATDWCQVSAGGFHTVALKTSGQIWGWGRNVCGSLGDGTYTQRCSPVREISSSTNWCQVSSGQSHVAALKTSGQLWSWGLNLCGILGDGTSTPRCSPVREISNTSIWCQVSGGGCHTAAIQLS